MAITDNDIAEAHGHVRAAIEHHEEGRHHAVRYRLGQAKRALDRAMGLEQDVDAGTNPTGDQGAQTSSGPSGGATGGPRSLSKTAITSRLLDSFRAGARGTR